MDLMLMSIHLDMDINAIGYEGYTMLTLSAEWGTCEYVEMLIRDYHADVFVVDGEGCTAYDAANRNAFCKDEMRQMLENKMHPQA